MKLDERGWQPRYTHLTMRCSPRNRVSCLRLSLFLPVLSFFASVVTAADAPKNSALDVEHLKLIRPRLQELVDNGTIPGAVALVARHGEIAYLDAVGFQDIENQRPMKTNSIFQIMSMTKPFTGVAIMMLVEQGKLELRRPVSDYLPAFAGQEIEEENSNGQRTLRKPANPVTVWELMCHTSGLAGDPDGELSDNPRTMRVTLAQAVDYYAHEHLKFEPGTHWSYSNMGIATLGRLIELASGEEYVHFIQTHILNELGMKDTFFFAPENMKDRIAIVYKHKDGKLVASGDEILAGDPRKYRAGAKYPAPEFGLYSTAPDLARFYSMLLAGGTFSGHRFLSAQAIETMRTVFTPDVTPSGWLGGTGYGLTFEVVNQPVGQLLLHPKGTFGHGGAFGTEGWMDPKHDLVRILMIQVSDGSAATPRAIVMQIGESAVVD
jgi:CubicO group peptidase (beta-lactamase class C family)